MSLVQAVTLGLSLAVLAGCGGTGMPPGAPSLPPVAVPPAAPNQAPRISGEDVCVSPLGVDHIFELQVSDADGDALSWMAEKQEPSGTLHERRGGPVPSGTMVTILYSPPAGRADENWITLTVIDGRGGSAIRRLYVRNR